MENIDKNFFVYMHINKINNKKYIGITKQNPKNRWGMNGQRYKDSPRFYNAIQKYGWNNFEHKILYENCTQEEACSLEKKLITEYQTTEKECGYNLTTGGEKHYFFTETTKQKLSEQKKGSKNPQWGSRRTDEEKKHLSNIQKELVEQGKQHSKKVLCINTGIIYNSCKEAARNTGSGNEKQATHIADVCNGTRQSCNNFQWKWMTD